MALLYGQNGLLEPAGCVWSGCLWSRFWFTATKDMLSKSVISF